MPWGAIIGGIIQSESAADASDEQRAAADYGTQVQNRQFRQIRSDQAPWRDAGSSAVNRLAHLLGIVPAGGGGSNASSAPGSSPLLGQVAPTVEGDLLMADRYGSPLRNNDLYESNQIYSRAYDQATAEQRAENERLGRQALGDAYDGTGWYLQGPQAADLQRRIRGFLPAANAYNSGDIQAQQAAQQAEQQRQQDAITNAGAGFGDLARQFSYDDFLKDPVTQASFEFGLNEGRRALDAQYRARGLTGSGALLKDLTRFGSDYGSQRAGESFNRFQTNRTNQFNQLASLAGLGQTAANQTSVAGMNAANNISNIGVGLGNAQAASTMAQGNIIGGTINNLGNWWNQRQMMNQMNQQQQPIQWQQTPDNNPYMASGGYQ